MAANKRSFNHPRRSKSNFRWTHVVAIIVVIAAVFFLLERLKRAYDRHSVVKPGVVELSPPPASPQSAAPKPYTTLPPPLPPKAAVSRPVAGKGTLAVIIDDMGSSVQEARELLAIKVPLTFSIIPGLAKSKAVAEIAADAGMKVMVHIPMEPQGYPAQALEKNGLLTAYGSEEITSRTEALLASIPAAVGANNHMGSRFTEQEEKMQPVLTVLKGRGLYFIDSRTTSRSVAYAMAKRMGIRTATRDVFLDNEQDVAAIRKQLLAAATLARAKGGVIAICHPHPATIQALKETLPGLQVSGVKFVAASELVR